jgi:hypothetical protein
MCFGLRDLSLWSVASFLLPLVYHVLPLHRCALVALLMDWYFILTTPISVRDLS